MRKKKVVCRFPTTLRPEPNVLVSVPCLLQSYEFVFPLKKGFPGKTGSCTFLLQGAGFLPSLCPCVPNAHPVCKWDCVFVPKEEMPNQPDCSYRGLRIKSTDRLQGLDLLGEAWWLLKYKETRSWWRMHWRGGDLMGSLLNEEEKQGNTVDAKGKKGSWAYSFPDP